MGFAAINTGNNLLYLLLGMMLSLILASGILSEMSLRGLRIGRQPPHRVHACTPALVGITLENTKTRLPSFSIEVEDQLDEITLDKRCWFLKVPAGREQRTSYRHEFPRRGRYRYSGFRVSTRFPFSLFRKWRIIDAPVDVIVYPSLVPIDRPPSPTRGSAGDEAAGRRNRRGEFYGLREYRQGDDVRDVHWRTSARRGRLLVREQEEEESRRVTLFVENGLPAPGSEPGSKSGGKPFGEADGEALRGIERAVSLAASLANFYVGRGYSVRLVARGEALPPMRSAAELDVGMRMLALLPIVDERTPFPVSARSGEECLYVVRKGAPPPRGDHGRVVAI